MTGFEELGDFGVEFFVWLFGFLCYEGSHTLSIHRGE